ncbi:hypothetical protein MKZ38_010034 [Zalerion maritima]|uniref:Uncharacterized protein n=1 Tax=Zalerion maritima TaxID=339359 RepID=A0AAD5WUR3_9PEZI|nr:hypothetical protein MKZ38_010034 [Zalerion maritima]
MTIPVAHEIPATYSRISRGVSSQPCSSNVNANDGGGSTNSIASKIANGSSTSPNPSPQQAAPTMALACPFYLFRPRPPPVTPEPLRQRNILVDPARHPINLRRGKRPGLAVGQGNLGRFGLPLP